MTRANIIGDIAEGEFQLWAKMSEVTINQSIKDEHGWDFIIELKDDEVSTLTDIHQSRLSTCFVQVKATDNPKNSCQVKLSNLKKMATGLHPSFFVFYKYNRNNLAQARYLVHLDKKLIHDILKKVTVHLKTPKVHKLNKLSMNIKYSKSDQIDLGPNINLSDIIKSHIGNDYQHYINDKIKFLKKVGYENGKHTTLEITLNDLDQIRNLQDLSLGLCDNTKIDKFKFIHKRFGEQFIEEPNESVTLSMSPLPLPNSFYVTFKKDKLSHGVNFPIQIYTSPFNQTLPKNDRKIKLSGLFFDMILWEDKLNLTINFDRDKRYSIHDLSKVFTFLKILSDKENVYIEIYDCDQLDDISSFNMSTSNIDYNIDLEYNVVKTIISLLKDFETHELDISLSEIANSYLNNSVFYDLINKKNNSFTFTFGVLDDKFKESDKSACISFLSTKLLSINFGVVITTFGKASKIGNSRRYNFDVDDFKIEKKVSTANLNAIRDELIELADKLADKYEKDYEVVNIVNKKNKLPFTELEIINDQT
jgi:hypothetical protein